MSAQRQSRFSPSTTEGTSRGGGRLSSRGSSAESEGVGRFFTPPAPSSPSHLDGLTSNGALPGGEEGARMRRVLAAHGVAPEVTETPSSPQGKKGRWERQMEAKGYRETHPGSGVWVSQ